MGKTTCVERLYERAIDTIGQVQMIHVSLCDRHICIDSLIDNLLQKKKQLDCPAPMIIHVDLSHIVKRDVDHVLFGMLVLGTLYTSSGRIWSKRRQDYYIVECLSLQEQGNPSDSCYKQ
ncbi:hypothetical protein CAPTEDRAFT_205227 [Capitella teleta]|uniref:Uncharacterized protein n=1 Tax=Capitella teleta TaxID=283909 RepID=R7TWA5_CAPTE|nr:hypothetical protein CAPTEDRAFT_205227 [Capitella teleta]|eukprot:ELT97852.1 hypothetical protein CAPTEDRAFT_205227 [Capitella teleta]